MWIEGTATYTADGVPPLVLRLEETLRFEGDRILHLEDRYAPAMTAELTAYLFEHGTRLGIELAVPGPGA